MKLRIHIIRYLLIAAAWLLVFISLPFPAGSLNGFLRRFGNAQTWFFIRWLFSMPGWVVSDLRYGYPIFWMDTLWMVVMLVGLILLFAAPILVHRARTPIAHTIVRCAAPATLLLPVTLFLPESYRFPIPDIGLWLLAAAHVLAFIALMLAEKHISPDHAFPITLKPL
jgi:hypothetical protein